MWNDRDLKIDWGIEEAVLSPKDSKNMSFAEFINEHKAIEL